MKGSKMKQLGNLAIVAASHTDCMLQIFDEQVTVHTGEGNDRKSYTCNVWDDRRISEIVRIINFGEEIYKTEGKYVL